MEENSYFKEFSDKEIKEKGLIADLHIHSKYSRACSKDLDFDNLVKWAKIKGVDLLGTGDFTHPKWLEEIKNLKEKNGIYYYKNFPFVLSSEISLIYYKNGKKRSVHLVYLAPSIEVVEKINKWLDTMGRRDYDGRPIFGITCRDFVAKMEEIDEKIEVIPGHAWTPWFGIFGSESGFDRLSDAFEDKSYLIHAIETGLSSDVEMNWKIKELDNRAIVSFSDAHSFWPWRLGREATIFKKEKEISYDEIIRQIREKDFFGTIEVDPAYGKYHYDGHRACNFSCSPKETKKLQGLCPICGKKLIVGVEYRVSELAKLGEANHKKKKFFYKVLPLHEVLALGTGSRVDSKKNWELYNSLVDKFGNEFNVILFEEMEKIEKIVGAELASLIIKNRESKIKVIPGYDGVYGKALVGEMVFENKKREIQGKLF